MATQQRTPAAGDGRGSGIGQAGRLDNPKNNQLSADYQPIACRRATIAARHLVKYALSAPDALSMTPTELATFDMSIDILIGVLPDQSLKALWLCKCLFGKPASVSSALDLFKGIRAEVCLLQDMADYDKVNNAEIRACPPGAT